MKILAIETASPPGSIALLEGCEVLALAQLDNPRKTTQQFASLIRDQLQSVRWATRDIQLVAATQGPGSFTGLRIGVTAAKTFAYALGCPVVGINTLEVIAVQCPPNDGAIEAVLDAQRSQLFAARFRHLDGQLQCVRPTSIMAAKEWLETQAPDAAVIGTGLKRYRDQLNEHPQIAHEKHWTPCAATLGQLAMSAAAEGKALDPMQLSVEYFRKSAAEEKMSES